ncbi:MAG: hypothetical protein JXA30_12225 [Deltaproteobacteria bacterium]|nr:hypothetical protein [Deltaproteobacteria bacterium]
MKTFRLRLVNSYLLCTYLFMILSAALVSGCSEEDGSSESISANANASTNDGMDGGIGTGGESVKKSGSLNYLSTIIDAGSDGQLWYPCPNPCDDDNDAGCDGYHYLRCWIKIENEYFEGTCKEVETQTFEGCICVPDPYPKFYPDEVDRHP